MGRYTDQDERNDNSGRKWPSAAPDATSPASQVGDDHGSFSQAKIPTGDAEMVCPLGHRMSQYSPDLCFACKGEIDKRTRDILRSLAEELSEASRGRVATKRTRTAQAKSEAANRIMQLVSDFSGSAISEARTASSVGMSEANAPNYGIPTWLGSDYAAPQPGSAPIPAVQSGPVAWRIDVPNGNYGFATSEAGAVNASRHSGGTITPLYAAPQSEPLPGVREPFTVDDLAQEIRYVDGSNSLGAGALAEALSPFIIERIYQGLVAVPAPPLPGGVGEREKIAAFLRERDEALEPGEANDEERLESAAEILSRINGEPK